VLTVTNFLLGNIRKTGKGDDERDQNSVPNEDADGGKAASTKILFVHFLAF
jgi:hypothetical protein